MELVKANLYHGRAASAITVFLFVKNLEYMNYCAKCERLNSYLSYPAKGDNNIVVGSGSQALCICVAAACGASKSCKKATPDCWSTYLVDCVDF